MKDEANDSGELSELPEHRDRMGDQIAELRARLEAVERQVAPLLERLEAVERQVAPLRALDRFWPSALGPWYRVPQDRALADLVDFVEQEGPEHLVSLLILFQRAVDADREIHAACRRLASHVEDLGLCGPGISGEAHQISVDLDCLASQLAGSWTHPSEALGPEWSPSRDLLTLARARQIRGECPGWVVARLKEADGDD